MSVSQAFRVGWFFTYNFLGFVPLCATMTELKVESHPTYPVRCLVAPQTVIAEESTNRIGPRPRLHLQLKAEKSGFPRIWLGSQSVPKRSGG